MKYAFLVALREYADNAKTKGFWIGIFLFPIILTISITVPEYLEDATPTRHFVLIDQSGEFVEVIEGGLNKLHLIDVVKDMQKYVAKHAKKPEGQDTKIDLEDVPAIDSMEAKVDEYLRTLETGPMSELGDAELEAMKKQVAPLLEEGAPEFEKPSKKFKLVGVPTEIQEEIDAQTGPDAPVLTDSEKIDLISESLRPYLSGEKKITVDGEETELFAAVLIPKNIQDVIIRPGPKMLAIQDRAGIQFWCTNVADNDLKKEIERVVNKEIRSREYLAENLDSVKVNNIQNTRVPFASLNPRKERGKEEVSLADQIRQWAPVGFVYLLWIGIFTITQMLLNNTIEEKSNRIIEVLLSSVTARELMLGKLLGIAGVGLTMISAWMLSLVVVLTVKSGPESEFAVQLFEVLKTSGLLPKFAVYFLLGYLIYSGIFLAIGSVCNTLKDAQNLMGPVMLIMIIPLMTMMFIPRDPHGVLATVMSWIPIYSPFIMMNRAAADPPMFDLVGTFIMMVVTAAFVLWMTGKIFRTGILRSGQPPRIVEMFRWLKAPK